MFAASSSAVSRRLSAEEMTTLRRRSSFACEPCSLGLVPGGASLRTPSSSPSREATLPGASP
eukprot:14295588-Heterocapsa_arctica.AAC.1